MADVMASLEIGVSFIYYASFNLTLDLLDSARFIGCRKTRQGSSRLSRLCLLSIKAIEIRYAGLSEGIRP